MRITQGMLNQQMLTDIQANLNRVSTLQNEVSTGKRINQPSDDPVGVGYVMEYNNELAYYNQYQNNASQATNWMTNTESSLQQATQVMQRARDLAVQGASDTLTASDRQSIASEVGQLYSQMVGIGNSQFNGKYVFNGQQTSTAPYQDAAALTNVTDAGQVLYQVGTGDNLNVGVSGNAFFGAATTAGNTTSDNAFAVLQRLQTALNANDTATIQTTLGQIDTRNNQMLATQADLGARMNQVQLVQSRLTDTVNNVTTLLASTQDVDMAKAITDLQNAQNVQTAALQVGAKVIAPSLVDFLK